MKWCLLNFNLSGIPEDDIARKIEEQLKDVQNEVSSLTTNESTVHFDSKQESVDLMIETAGLELARTIAMENVRSQYEGMYLFWEDLNEHDVLQLSRVEVA